MSEFFAQNSRRVFPATIAAAGTDSDVVDLGGGCLIGIETDANFVTGNITFKGTAQAVASSEGRFQVPALSPKTVIDSANAAATITGAGASETIPFTSALQDLMKPIRHVQLIAGAAQTNGTVIYLITQAPS